MPLIIFVDFSFYIEQKCTPHKHPVEKFTQSKHFTAIKIINRSLSALQNTLSSNLKHMSPIENYHFEH